MLGDGLGLVHAGPAHWTIEGGVRGASVGVMSMRRADFDGDGRADWAVAAPRFPVRGRVVGKVWVLAFGSNGPPRVTWSWQGEPTMQRTGSALEAGDFDGDGFTDLAIGAPFERDRGEVFIFSGSRTNLSREPTRRLKGYRERGRFGMRLLAWDVDGDGRDDLLVGAPSPDAEQSRLLLFRGTAQGLADAPAWTMDGSRDGLRVGAPFALLDANGDGRADLAVGRTHYGAASATNLGRVDLYLGTNGLFASTPAWSLVGPSPGALLGQTLRALGDLNKDGREDLAVGCGGSGPTAVYLGTTDGLSRTSAWSRAGSPLTSSEGDNLGPVGDVDGDGWNDVLAWDSDPGVIPGSQGGAHLFRGGPGGLASAPSWTVRMFSAPQRLGRFVAAAGDLNGDGLMDFALASPTIPGGEARLGRAGRVDIFLGRREGYRAGDNFPTDGINSQSRVEAVTEAHRIADAGKPVIVRVPAKLSRWWMAGGAGMLALGGVAFAWSRTRHRRATSLAVHSERERIARDLHDGLGSGVHRLQRLTELLGRTATGSEEAVRLREDMLRTAQELSGSLDRTIWVVKPENDTLENLVNFLAAYAPSVLEPHAIECELDLPPLLPAVPLQGDMRQNLFLVVNEALQNVVKHAGARRVWLRVQWEASTLAVQIEDDGVGLEANAPAARRAAGGNGLLNQRQRVESLGGTLTLKPRAGGGTTVSLRLPIDEAVAPPRRSPEAPRQS